MIQCCMCEDWFHEEHLGLESSDEVVTWDVSTGLSSFSHVLISFRPDLFLKCHSTPICRVK